MIELFESVYTIAIFIQWELVARRPTKSKKKIYSAFKAAARNGIF